MLIAKTCALLFSVYNIIVGDNESGKSTLLEAINLALTGQINGRSILYELSPFLVNKSTVSDYLEKLRNDENPPLPRILIELYLTESQEVQKLRGTNNSSSEDCPGISYIIQFNNEYFEEYNRYVEDPSDVRTIPTEYYEVKWYSFANNLITIRSLPIKSTLLDTSTVRLRSGTDYYIQKVIEEILEPKDKAGLSLLYRKLKESFANEDSINAINERLRQSKDIIADKELTVSIDISHKTSWESTLTSYINEIPFQYIGKGDQNILKMMFALQRKKAKESHIVLIEEPENHLSFSTMNKLINMLTKKFDDKQLFITTHNTFILNKLGISKLILISDKQKTITLNKLSEGTQLYFKKLPGYDTLRLVLSKNTILTEGPSDELIVQKAYLIKYGKLPIFDGIDVLSVRGLSFKRYLEIAQILEKQIRVITDNDGNISDLEAKYKDFFGDKNIEIFYDKDESAKSLEQQLVKFNEISIFNKIFHRNDKNEEEIIKYMQSNKTDCALKIFESSVTINIPEYIQNAIK